MKHWLGKACVWIGAGLVVVSPLRAEQAAAPAAKPAERVVVEVRPNRIILMDVAQAGRRLVAVGERGFTMVSDDSGQQWQAVATPVTRTLTAVAFRDDKVGVAVGHGGTVVRTEDGGTSWHEVAVPEMVPESFLGVTSLGGDRFLAYGAFGGYFDSTDAGRTWAKRMVESEDFDRHISQVIPVGDALLMVAESGTLARSVDGGMTWTALESPYQGSYFGALQLKSGAVLVYGMRGNVYRSTDAGATWQKIALETTASIMAGRELADGSVLLVGNTGLLADSRDGGLTFNLHWAPKGQGFAGTVESGGKVLLVGETGITTLDPAWLTNDRPVAGQ